jgi:hypothetical protein
MKTAYAIESVAWPQPKEQQVSEDCNLDGGAQFFTGLVTGVLLSLPFWVAVSWLFLR